MKKETIRFDVAPRTYDRLLMLIESGLWGETADDVALRCMYVGLQEARRGFPERPLARRAGCVEVHETGGHAPPVITFQKPKEMPWCEQCDQRVSLAKAQKCKAPFCKAKGEHHGAPAK